MYDLLPELLDEDILDDIMSSSYKNVLYKGRIDGENGMPVEFSSAAWRLFHSRLASGYRLQGTALVCCSSLELKGSNPWWVVSNWVLDK